MAGRIPINHRKRQKVFERDDFTCQNCNQTGNFNALEVDHIVPVCHGGCNDMSNLQTLCYRCNMDKRFNSDVNYPKNLEKTELKNNFDPEKLINIIKKRILEKYKGFSYEEFTCIFRFDPLFRKLRLDLGDLKPLFMKLNRLDNAPSTTMAVTQRTKLIMFLKEKKNISFKKIGEITGLAVQSLYRIVSEEKKNRENLQDLNLKEDISKHVEKETIQPLKVTQDHVLTPYNHEKHEENA